ncbi:MAG: galactokinase [Candidatus Aminicenantaceae bacterium]
MTEKQLISLFKNVYKKPPEIISSAPGRINIIGEHTDYNLGYVLPAAINFRVYFLVSERKDNKVHLRSENFNETDEFDLKKLKFSTKKRWSNYAKGVVWALKESSYALNGFDSLIWGDVPIEAGLSSSAAYEVSAIHGLNTLFHLNIASEKMAFLSRKAENDFVGVKCGIMDQFISVLGEKEKALFLDCETFEYRYVPFPMEKKKIKIVVYVSGVFRELASSEYNKRQKESFEGREILKKSGIRGYKEASLQWLEQNKEKMDFHVYKRARHIITENERVKKSADALENNDFSSLGELLFKSHESLRDDYEVSCPELDLLYETGRKFPGCKGARMIGAGFGGSGIALVDKEQVDDFKYKIIHNSQKRGFVKPSFIEVEISDGAQSFYLNNKEKGHSNA